MILFTAGYPFSGKTEFVKLLTAQLNSKQIKTVLIDPASIRPPEYDQMSPDDQRAARLAAWEVTQESLSSAIKNEPQSTLIIYDSCAAKLKTMLPHFVAAKIRHIIFYAFIGATLDECKKRAGDKWLSPEIIKGYAADFGESAPRLRPLCSHFKFVKNNDDPEKKALHDAANHFARVVLDAKNDRVQESPSVRSTAGRAR